MSTRHCEPATGGRGNLIPHMGQYEAFEDCTSAIQREKQIKAGSRKKKEQLINTINKERRDLYDEL